MIFIDSFEQLKTEFTKCKSIPVALALGTFDGIHKGHKSVIKKTTEDGFLPSVFVVERPFMGVERTPYRIISESDKKEMFSSMGIKKYIELPFSDYCELEPEDFFKSILVDTIGVKRIVCGFNFRFGKNALGNTETLKELCNKYDIELIVIEPVFDGDSVISSSRIRQALTDGHIDTALRLLGHDFAVSFTVVGGDRLGRKLGFPTINQPLPEYFIRPKFGVYAAKALVEGKIYPAVCNIGVRPTVSGSTAPRAETYIIGYSGDLYGTGTPISLLKFLRPEIKFNSISNLKEAIKKDAEIAEKVVRLSINKE